MLDYLRKVIQNDCQLQPSELVLVGVSGGPDSLCLLDVLHNLGYQLVVAHLNHGLRPEAGLDSLAVEREAAARGLPFILEERNVAAYAEKHSFSLEEAARTVRYRFLFDQAQHYRVQAVAVGHTADDQVETVLMHLLRGAGISGLKSMQPRMLPNPWSQEIPLVRPLLSIWHRKVLDYCAERGLKPVFDRTNLDTTFFRNRLRRQLIPYLEGYNPAIKQVLWRTAQVLAGDYEVLEGVMATAWAACVKEQGKGYVGFEVNSLRQQPLGARRYLVRRAISVLQPELRDVDYDTVEHALAFLAQPPQSRQADLAAGLRLVLEDHRLWIAAWEASLPSGTWPQVPENFPSRLDLPEGLALRDGWRLHAEAIPEVASIREKALANSDPYQTWVDRSALKDPLFVRARQTGDRFQPLGMGGHWVKLSEFMINHKMPRRARPAWPLVCAGDGIVWVPGFRLAHPFRLTQATREVIYLRLFRQ